MKKRAICILTVIMLMFAVAASAQTVETGYFISIDGQQTGPHSIATLRQIAQNGMLTRTTLIWKEGMTNWVIAGLVDEVATIFSSVPPPLPQSANTSRGNNISTSQDINRTYNIGEQGPSGGIIFYDKRNYSDGWRYLEAAPSDTEFVAQWSPLRTKIGRTNKKIGRGIRNTILIANRLNQLGESGYAAQLCASLEINGFDDWFLPSAEELMLMYRNLHQKGLHA